MIFRASLFAVVALWSLPIAASANADDDAKQIFDALYGESIAEAKRTPARSDDVELARELLKVAKESKDKPKLVKVLCDNAAVLGKSDRAGFTTAIEALNLIREIEPNAHDVVAQLVEVRRLQFRSPDRQQKKPVGEQFIADLLDAIRIHKDAKQYDAAIKLYIEALSTARSINSSRQDAIRAGLAETRDAKRQADLIADLQTRILKDPNDKRAVEQLLRIYVIELDDPKSAGRYAPLAADDEWQNNVPLATKPVEKLSAVEAQSLANWFQGLAEAAHADFQLPMLKRAQQYHRRFLELHKAKDAARTKAEFALKAIEIRIAKLAAPIEVWIDLLALVDLRRDVHGGRIKAARGGALELLERGDATSSIGRFEVPMAISGSYKLKVRFTRTGKDRISNVLLPVHGKHQLFYFSDNAAGFTIAGKRPKDAQGAFVNKWANGDSHEFEIEVSPDKGAGNQADFSIDFDGKGFLKWKGQVDREFDGAKIGMQRDDTVGIYSSSHLRIESIQLKVINGKAVPLRK